MEKYWNNLTSYSKKIHSIRSCRNKLKICPADWFYSTKSIQASISIGRQLSVTRPHHCPRSPQIFPNIYKHLQIPPPRSSPLASGIQVTGNSSHVIVMLPWIKPAWRNHVHIISSGVWCRTRDRWHFDVYLSTAVETWPWPSWLSDDCDVTVSVCECQVCTVGMQKLRLYENLCFANLSHPAYM